MMKEVVTIAVLSRKPNRDILPELVLQQESFHSHAGSHAGCLCACRFYMQKA